MIQVVCVKWGDKYGAKHVNHLYQEIIKKTNSSIRFVCLTDNLDDEYDVAIIKKSFPKFSLTFQDMKRNCRLKLAIFCAGLLAASMPTVFFDLDVAVLGDVAVIAGLLNQHRAIHILPSHYIQLWRVQKYIRPLIGARYYCGNSSILAFYPEDFHHIYDDFNRAAADPSRPRPRHLNNDDRFISNAAKDRLRVFPRRIAVKFGDEFMLPFAFLEDLRKRLPWVAARRRSLVAVAFVGNTLKPDTLANMRKGDLVLFKRRRVHWDYANLSEYWRD